MRRQCLLFLGLFSYAFAPGAAYALLPDMVYTESQKAGFAFYRLAHRTPDFRGWTEGDGAGDQQEILRDGFRTDNPAQDMVKLAVPVSIDFDESKVLLSFSPDKMTVFPVRVGGLRIGIVPSNEDAFRSFPVSAAATADLNDAMDGSARIVTADVMLRPESVDARKPMMIDGQPVWLMMAAIADVQVWDRSHKTIVWSASAPWYQAKRNANLMDLKK